MQKKQAFTGRARRRKTRASVKVADSVARGLITIGGVGTILAIGLVFVYLAWVVWPLLDRAHLQDASKFSSPSLTSQAGRTFAVGTDEYRVIGWSIEPDGKVVAVRLDNGDLLRQSDLSRASNVTAVSMTVNRKSMVVGYDSGALRVGELSFRTTFPDRTSLPARLQEIAAGDLATYQGGVLHVTEQGDPRLQKMAVDVSDDLKIGNAKIMLLDHVVRRDLTTVAALLDDGRIIIGELEKAVNQFTGAETLALDSIELDYERHGGSAPDFLLISGLRDSLNLVWRDGVLHRYDISDLKQPSLVEVVRLVEPERDAQVTQAEYLLGGSTIVVGTSDGRLSAWFRSRHPDAETSDGTALVRAHQLPPGSAGVTSLGMSSRKRMFVAGFEDGTLRVYHVTTDQILVEAAASPGKRVAQVALSPRSDGLFARAEDEFWLCGFDPAHPEATWSSLFLPVWYENAPGPDTVWQSTSGSEAFEPKFGLYPLIFGTIKATVYSMLFGAPLALLAAIYTSEFLHPRVRTRIKPTIELMASLPSVVLGFIAGLVIAPLVQGMVPAVLASFYVVPFVLLLCAHLWQLLPYRLVLMLQWWRLLFVFVLVLPLSFWLAYRAGPLLEKRLFAGDLMHWLSDRDFGTGTGGWLLMGVPLCSVLTAVLVANLVNPRIRSVSRSWSRYQSALVGLAKFVVATAFTLGLAYAVSWLATSYGLDPRGSFLGKYDQRNTLVVGFAMGFAIIPIIYTIADDALSTVPQHLRSASLATGATAWQTATRVVIPTAMSGLFSALMIGLGRAVGETMIVLMATGNTPVKDWNIFNGFRTLSANIAVELPEAPRGETHFRTLFLAALTLFLMTFVVNTCDSGGGRTSYDHALFHDRNPPAQAEAQAAPAIGLRSHAGRFRRTDDLAYRRRLGLGAVDDRRAAGFDRVPGVANLLAAAGPSRGVGRRFGLYGRDYRDRMVSNRPSGSGRLGKRLPAARRS